MSVIQVRPAVRRPRNHRVKEHRVKPVFGGIEAGGTKFVCIVASGPDEVIAEAVFPTTGPDQTIGAVIDFFEPYQRQSQLEAVGIATFGPVDLDPASPTYGFITSTPKPGWRDTNLLGAIRGALGLPVAFDTDVNGAAYGEYTWVPDNQHLDSLAYITVGTGIGVGFIVNGRPLHGLVHPEAGHMIIPHDRDSDPFPGVCPYHGDCFEGLASGVSIEKRWGQSSRTLPASHPGWDLEAGYIALALFNLACTCSPQRIIFGGGISQHAGIHAAVRREVMRVNNGYIRSRWLEEDIDQYIVPPALGSRSGALGAVAMAMALGG